MSLLATLRIALAALRVNKLRSALTMLGIVIGVGAVIAMTAIGAGAQARVEDQIRSLGSNLIIVLPGNITSGGVRMGSGAQLTLSEDDAAALPREIPEIEVAAPQLRGGGQVVFGNSNWATQILGVTTDYLVAREWALESGREFTGSDIDAAAKIVLVGQTVARTLFGESDPVGETIRIRNVPHEIVGLLERKGQSMIGQDQDDVVLIPISTARKRVLGGQQVRARNVGSITVKVRQGADVAHAEQLMRDLLRQRHRLQANQEDDFFVRNLSEVLSAQEASSRVLAILLAAIASVSLLVGGIGIMNIMLVSVTERTREIGLRMAVGAKSRDILTQFLVEAVTLSLIGGIVGIVLGAIASVLVGEFAGWRTEMGADAVLLAFGFSAAVGVFFGFYPARKASRLVPIEALRHE
ncbi:Macrolide export ATP-binding/permease protein MacB [Burkholderiales bacterium]|nr:Macrolide export ATP-binding/permease protein MacB [Burkholderiales bacterium]